jgi:uncharacterized lipoprotein YbaY/uncharacterized membrane protein
MEIIREIQENWKYLLLSILIAIFLISFSNAQAAAAELNVNLSYRERIALSPEAEARLMLVDQSQREEKLIIIDQRQTLENGVPVNFKLKLNNNELEAGKNYHLLGLIKDQEDLIWTAVENLTGQELLQKKEITMVTSRKPARLLSFRGEKDFKVRFLDSMAQLIIDEQEYILPQQRTASGAKFANSKISVWNKGRDIYLEKDGRNYKASLLSLANFEPNQDIIIARGQEPPWQLEINQERLKLNYGYLSNQINIARQNVEIIEKDNYLLYKVQTSFLNFEIKLLEDFHQDAMNGKIYPLTAFIRINGQKYIGGADLK